MVDKIIRNTSWHLINKIGLPVNPNLPELGELTLEKNTRMVSDRLLCLLATAASVYGFSRQKALEWIHQESLINCLEEPEKIFLETGEGRQITFKTQIEAMWALAWSLNMFSNLDNSKECSSTFAKILPDLNKMESSQSLRIKAQIRSEKEIIINCDYLYCLHWAVRQVELENRKSPLGINNYVIRERRRALEWLLTRESWYSISLDT